MRTRLFVCLTLMSLGLWAEEVRVPSGIDHAPYDALLRKYVDARGRVDYTAWHASKPDRDTLKAYLLQYAPAPGSPAEGKERIASLLNAYNAFTIDFILDHFPTESIRKLDDPFTGKRHRAGGRDVSLDEIEHDTLRPLIGWKVHALVVCAARSCPPLHHRAYAADTWETTMKHRYRAWLGRKDLNRFLPGKDQVRISKIFDWYAEDFTDPNGIRDILTRFGPAEHKEFLSKGTYRIRYIEYHWGLNAQSDLGETYTHSFFKSLF